MKLKELLTENKYSLGQFQKAVALNILKLIDEWMLEDPMRVIALMGMDMMRMDDQMIEFDIDWKKMVNMASAIPFYTEYQEFLIFAANNIHFRLEYEDSTTRARFTRVGMDVSKSFIMFNIKGRGTNKFMNEHYLQDLIHELRHVYQLWVSKGKSDFNKKKQPYSYRKKEQDAVIREYLRFKHELDARFSVATLQYEKYIKANDPSSIDMFVTLVLDEISQGYDLGTQVNHSYRKKTRNYAKHKLNQLPNPGLRRRQDN